MARHHKARSIAVLAVLLVVAAGLGACSSRTKAGTTAKPELRGVAVRRFVCPPQPESSAEHVTPIGRPRALLLCPLSIPGLPKTTVTITPARASFPALIVALSAPDEPPTTGACPAYGDIPQLVLASTDHGVYQVSIPVDACHHYQEAALAALHRARAT